MQIGLVEVEKEGVGETDGTGDGGKKGIWGGGVGEANGIGGGGKEGVGEADRIGGGGKEGVGVSR